MPQPDSALAGAPCWIDLASSDPGKSKEFYCGVFGWSAQEAGEELGNYVTFSVGDKPIAGMASKDASSEHPDGWSTYLSTDDANATAKAAEDNGGKVLLEPMKVADQGSMAVLCDAGGATVVAWQADSHQGFGLVGEAGAPVWHELSTRDYEETVKFYEGVFNWKTEVMSDSDEFRYTTLGSGNDAKAGIFDAGSVLPGDVPASWQVYLGVDDVDAAVKKVQKLGGTVQRQPWDSDYGRMAQVTDSTGAVFVLSSV